MPAQNTMRFSPQQRGTCLIPSHIKNVCRGVGWGKEAREKPTAERSNAESWVHIPAETTKQQTERSGAKWGFSGTIIWITWNEIRKA